VNNSALGLHPSRLNWFSLTAAPGCTMNSMADLFGIEEYSNLNSEPVIKDRFFGTDKFQERANRREHTLANMIPVTRISDCIC